LYYTVSGIITPVGGRPVRRLREDGTATYRYDDTRCCIIQFWCSKHVDAYNKLIIK